MLNDLSIDASLYFPLSQLLKYLKGDCVSIYSLSICVEAKPCYVKTPDWCGQNICAVHSY